MFGRPCCDRQNDISQSFVGNNNDVSMNVDINMNQGQMMMGGAMSGSVSQPIIEPGQERVVNRTILHEVPQE